ncbi:hypothetical protein GQ55_5G535300 [Panicum hallii var. hallii]|uniref:Uncharacterized protein n=1 Tax=Panicum hallii var. hallii TaxID=1504633 RepID=A0A2T7DT82_9POAL|nr:hypothetical protein GQ55_5G535300 [Panicum hallii var. hallii]
MRVSITDLEWGGGEQGNRSLFLFFTSCLPVLLRSILHMQRWWWRLPEPREVVAMAPLGYGGPAAACRASLADHMHRYIRTTMIGGRRIDSIQKLKATCW